MQEARRGLRGPSETAGRAGLAKDCRPTHYAGMQPYLLLMVGFVLGALSSPVFYIGLNGPDPFSAMLLLIAAGTLLGYLGWLLTRQVPKGAGPRPGGEKQPLMAILDAGGSITPVEAALQTSLTVDEAEEILTRFADRGHLLVEGRDGALVYVLPGRHLTSET
jgi:hypothetical protein